MLIRLYFEYQCKADISMQEPHIYDLELIHYSFER